MAEALDNPNQLTTPPGLSPTRLLLTILLPSLFLFPTANLRLAAAATPPPASPKPSAPDLNTPPRTWAAAVAANEVRAIQHQGSYLRYYVHTHDQKGTRVRDTIESKDGPVARLILKDGKPLAQDEDQAERERLNEILSSPSSFAKHTHNDTTGKKLAIDLVQLMPDAMLFTYTPGQPQIASPVSPQVVLDYAPNPQWSPPNTTAEGLTGLRGRMWIDPKTRQLLHMEGTIFQGVNFGWGMLAHIYPGGTLALTQRNVAGDRWIFSSFVERVKVRALMVKSINVDAEIESSNIQVLPGPISYQEAVRLLLAAPSPAR